MNEIRLSKQDFRFLMLVLALVPVMGFIAGLYAADQFRLDKHPISQVSEPPNVAETISGTEVPDGGFNPPALPSLPAEQHYIVQAGLFASLENAKKQQALLLEAGVETNLRPYKLGQRIVQQVVIRSFDSRKDADEFMREMKSKYRMDLYVVKRNDDVDVKTVALL